MIGPGFTLMGTTIAQAASALQPAEIKRWLPGFNTLAISTPTNPKWPLFIQLCLSILLDPAYSFKDPNNNGTCVIQILLGLSDSTATLTLVLAIST